MINKHKETLKKIVPWIAMILIMYVMTLLKLPIIMTNLLFVFMTAFLMYRLWAEASDSKAEVLILMCGLGVRILVCLLDIYGSGFMTVPFSGDDSRHFFDTSVAYYHGDMSRLYTNYPYIILAIYKIAGLNRFAAQYVNILCWCFCGLLMQKSCGVLKVEKNLRLVAVGLLSVLPFHICISSILMRDMIVTLSIMLTTYLILRWMKSGNYINLFLGMIATAPVMLVHNCVLAMIAVMGLMAAFYSPKKCKFCIEKKCIIICGIAVLCVLLIVLIPPLGEKIFTQIPIFDGGIIDIINERLAYFYENSGGSTYLLNQYVSGYGDLIIGTFQRIGYFLFSPVPWMWRGLGDVVVFLISSCVYLTALVICGISFFFKKKDAFRFLFASVIFFVCAIFAWGVSNGGTAMRHREKLLGVAILLAVYSVQLIINKRKERKMN